MYVFAQDDQMYEELISSNKELRILLKQHDRKLNRLETRHDTEIKVMKARIEELENSCAAKNDKESRQPVTCKYDFLYILFSKQLL